MSFGNCLKFAVLALALTAGPGLAGETMVIGGITDNVKKELARTEPLAAYLQAALAKDGVTKVAVLPVKTSAEMVAAMREGRVDLLFDSPLVAADVARKAGGVPFVRRWKDGVASYHSVIFVPADSPVETLADLRGRRIGFQEPDSTSGYMLPAGVLRREGIAMRELGSKDEVPDADELGYVFTGDDKNTLMWIYSGWLDAAATDQVRFAELDRAQPGGYRVIARSIEVPRQAGVVRGDLDPALVDRITEMLLAMNATSEGRDVLAKFNETDRFDAFPGGADATFATIYEVLDGLAALGVK